MLVFVTGATGFVGAAVVRELLSAGHAVLGLARSDASAAALLAAGATVQRGSLDDLDSLKAGATMADGVIHTAFNHDFSRFAEHCEQDRRAIEALGAALAGSQRPMVVTAGVAMLAPGRLALETDPALVPTTAYPRASETMAATLAERGVNVSIVRLPPSVHDVGDHGFVPMLINIARQKGVSASIGDGRNRWPAVHRLDAARLFRLALEQGVAGARYHAVAEGAIPFHDIAAAIGRGLNVPVTRIAQAEAAAHFDWFALFAGMDVPASSSHTREQLGWQPVHAGLLEDMATANYF